MGKSKRIRSERAREIAANPEKYVTRPENSKNTNNITRIIAIVMAAIILIAVAVTALSCTGTLIRLQTTYSSANYSISGTMFGYIYYTQYNYMYNLYYSYFGSSAANYVSSIRTSATNSAKSQAEQILVLCEAAKAAGVVLEEEDFAEIDETIATIEESAKTSNMSISVMYGNLGISINDIRQVLELTTLASKYDEQMSEKFEDAIKDDEAAILEYVNKHKSEFYKADYITYTVESEDIAKALAEFKTADEFKSEIIRILVDANYASEFKTASSKLEPSVKPVVDLTTAIKKVMVAELKYSLLEIEIEDLDLDEKKTRKARLEAIFDHMFSETTFIAGEDDTDSATATTISADLYSALATAGDAISKTVKTALDKAVIEESKYALPDAADEEEKDDETDETTASGSSSSSSSSTKKEPTEEQKWVFADDRKENDTTVITGGTETKKTYTAVLCVKPNYLDDEITKNVGHLLLKVETETVPSGATAEEKKEIEAANDKAFADKKVKAEELLAEFNKQASKTKDDFEKFSEKHNEDSNIFYDDVRTGQMVEEFEEWLFDEKRTEGETGLVKTEYGWHIMYFVSNSKPVWQVDAIEAYVDDEWNDWYEDQKATYKVNVNENAVANVCG